MDICETDLPGVIVLTPPRFPDHRGFLMETYRQDRYRAAGLTADFVQDNHSRSRRGVLRGLHFQQPNAQGKLVQVIRGSIFDVAVDVRRGSPHFGCWAGVELSDENRRQIWVPPGFAHGFLTLSEEADVLYKCTALYAPGSEQAILWSDSEIGIDWPLDSMDPIVSAKDAAAAELSSAPVLPDYDGKR